MAQNMFYFLFFDQVQGDNGELFVKKSSVDPFNEERDYHGEIKSNEVIRCPVRLLKASSINTYYFIFSSSPVNMPSYSPQKYTFVFVQKKENQNKVKQKSNRVSYSGCKIIVIRDINGMKAF